MLFQRRPHVIESVECGLVQAAGLAGHAQHFLGEVDRAGLRLGAILFPISVENRFDDVGVKEGGQGIQAFDRYAELPHCQARHRHKLSPPVGDR